jgi:DNA topoisomerase-1
VPARFKLEQLSIDEAISLIDEKLVKEANRYIQIWEEEKIAIENGRWGPYIKFGKNNIKIPKNDGQKWEASELAQVPLETVKSWITQELPDAFSKEQKTSKKTTTKKPAAKKSK